MKSSKIQRTQRLDCVADHSPEASDAEERLQDGAVRFKPVFANGSCLVEKQADGGTDWRPLHTLSHLCDVLVWAGPNSTDKAVRSDIPNTRQRTSVGDGLHRRGASLALADPALSIARLIVGIVWSAGKPGVVVF